MLFLFLDKFVKPRGGAIKKLNTKATGITREHIENLGEDFDSVREQVIEGKFTIVLGYVTDHMFNLLIHYSRRKTHKNIYSELKKQWVKKF